LSGLLLTDDVKYPEYGMRTPISRFSAFAGTGDLVSESYQAVTGVTPAAAPATRDQHSALEQQYPAVVRALTLLWGHPEMNQYFEKVWSGQDPSLNLDPDAMAELMLLAAVHQRVCPYRPAKSVEELYGAGHWADTWKPAGPRR
jgi:hypothetical protein